MLAAVSYRSDRPTRGKSNATLLIIAMRHNLIMAIPHIKDRKRMCICHINVGLLWHMDHTTTRRSLWIYVHISIETGLP